MTAIFDRLLNFRDFGGDSVIRRKLFRSAALDRVTDADLEVLDSLGIGTIVDLRRRGERLAAPSRRSPASNATLVESMASDSAVAPHERFLGGDDLGHDTLHGRMIDWYADAPFDSEHRVMFRRAIQAVAEADRPVLIHCAAGKDRTGLVVMLIQHLLGLSHVAQLAEFLRTNDDPGLRNHLNTRLIAAAAGIGKRLDPAAAVGLTGASAAAFTRARQAMAERHGSIDGYLVAIGIGEEVRTALRRRYLATPPQTAT